MGLTAATYAAVPDANMELTVITVAIMSGDPKSSSRVLDASALTTDCRTSATMTHLFRLVMT